MEVDMRPIRFLLIDRRFLLASLATLPLLSASYRFASAQTQSDPLPSWNEGATKASILDFVARVTTQGGPFFVPVEQRIATFDNDGTLWVEQPMYVQLAFVLDRVKVLAPMHPEWKTKQPFAAVLDGDLKALAASGEKGLVELFAATHAGMTTAEFEKIVTDWLATARDHRFKRPYTELIYQPMLELLAYLRANGFKTFITSGGGIEFMRPWTERIYGIPPEQVVGSSIKPGSRCATARPYCSGCRISISSMTRRESQSASMSTSAVVPLRPSAIPTATSKCCNGRRSAPVARGLA
jgi:phosphoglycolate phosphatase-like HAD superfamily hydrolase